MTYDEIKKWLEDNNYQNSGLRTDRNHRIDLYLSDVLYDFAQQQVKNLNIPTVSNSLPVDYLQKEMIKAIKELAKESTAPDKDTPDWMENDIKRGMQWMYKRLTGNDC